MTLTTFIWRGPLSNHPSGASLVPGQKVELDPRADHTAACLELGYLERIPEPAPELTKPQKGGK